MANRKSSEKIPPFPPEIDREHFASWLSGFVDGEGHFGLGIMKKKSTGTFSTVVHFSVRLRYDDRPILEVIRSFWQCGIIYNNHYVGDGNDHDSSDFSVNCKSDIIEILIPHFKKYPLLAKKKRDFVIWREAAEFAWEVCPYPGGNKVVWTPEKLNHFQKLVDALRDVRKPDSLPPILPARKEKVYLPTLFDGLS